MSNILPAPNGLLSRAPMDYTRHQPEQTLLYQVIDEHYPAFLSRPYESGKSLPPYVQDEFEVYLKCGCLEYDFYVFNAKPANVRNWLHSVASAGLLPELWCKGWWKALLCWLMKYYQKSQIRQWVLSVPFPLRWLFAIESEMLRKALLVVTKAISTYLIKKAGFTHKTAKTGAVTLIQRFGSALNLNIHFHMLFLDGVYEVDCEGTICQFHEIKPPTPNEMNLLLHRISERIARILERAGYLKRDEEECGLILEGFEDEVMNHLQGSSITYRIAMGSQQGRKVLTIKTLPPRDELEESTGQALAKVGGFSLHAGVSAKAHQRAKVERLCRYIARPAVSTHRLERLPDGQISYELKTPYKNGTTHVVFEPLDFIAHLAALVPKPRVHLTRFHGVFAPNSKHRGRVTGEVKINKNQLPAIDVPQNCEERRSKMSWAMRLKRVFNIDVTVCRHCQGSVKIIACIEEPSVINKILASINQHQKSLVSIDAISDIRAPPTKIVSQMAMNY